MNNEINLDTYQRLAQEFMVHKRLLEENYLHNRFEIKALLVNPKVYMELMDSCLVRDKICVPDDLNMCGLQVAVSETIPHHSWAVELI